MIKNIVFDVGNVLVEWDPKKALRELGIDGEDMEAVLNATVRSDVWNESDRSTLSDEELLSRMIGNAPGYEEQIRQLWEHVQLAIWQFDYSRAWINRLKENGYRVYILSNYSKYAYEKTIEALSFLEDVDGALFSYEVHQIKPEPEIYLSLLQKFHLNAEECVFLDDRKENVEAAKQQGICGIQFHTYEQAVAELQKYGVNS